MSRPLTGGDRQRPRTVHLRDRPQWQELLPHLEQLGIGVVLADDLPWFDEAVVEFMQFRRTGHAAEKVLDQEKVREMLKCRFPEKKPTAIDAALDLMRWTDELLQAGYASARKGTPAACDPMSTVAIHLTEGELLLIVTETDVARTKKLRPKLEAMVGSQQDAQLPVHEWGRLVCSLCGGTIQNGKRCCRGWNSWALKPSSPKTSYIGMQKRRS